MRTIGSECWAILKALGEYGIDWLHDITKDVWNSGKLPDGWRNSDMVPIHKQKRDVKDWEAIEELS